MGSGIDAYFRNLAERRWGVADKRRSGAWSETWRKLLDDDPLLSQVRITVELVFGGDVVIRAATEPMETVSSTTGEVYHYAPLLHSEPEVSSSVEIGNGSASLRSITLTLDGRLVKPLSVVNSGRILAGFGEVSLQANGMDWDDRIVLLRGDMAGGVTFGADEELVDFEIVDPELTTDRLIPPVVLRKPFYPQGRDGDFGRRFPIVLTDHPGVPCLLIESTAFIRKYAVALAAETAVGTFEVEVDALIIEGVRQLPSGTFPFTVASENERSSGRKITVVEMSGALPDEDLEVYAEVSVPADQILTLAGVIRTLLRDYSIVGAGGIDEDIFGAAEARLPPGLSTKTLINGSGSGDTTRAIEYLQSTLAADFPMLSFAWTGNGFAPVVIDRRRGGYVADLRRAQYPLFDRLSSISESAKGDLRNTFAYRYSFDLGEDAYTGFETRDASNSLICRISQESIGQRDGDVIEAATVYDEQTAIYCVNWMVEHLALPHYVVEYEGASMLALTLRLGDNVRLSDDKLGWSQVPATVMGLTYARGRAVVRFAVWLLYANLPGGAESGTGIVVGGSGTPQGSAQQAQPIPGAND